MSARAKPERAVTAGGQIGCRPAFVQPRAGPTVATVGTVMNVGTVGSLQASPSMLLRWERLLRRSLRQRSRLR
jgi:hypothetical protein